MSILRFSGNTFGPGNEFAKIQKQACKWVVRLDGGQMADADKKVLADWLATSQEHRRIFYDTATCWMAIDQLSAIKTEYSEKAVS